MITPGDHIESTPLLKDTYFEDTKIFIIEKNENGAIGFVLNRPYSRSLQDLEAFKHTYWPLFEGGPVDQEHIYILHKRPDLIHHSKNVYKNIFVGGDMNDVVKAIQQKEITEDQLILFLGYCGWDGMELEAEIKEGSWVMAGL